MIFLSLSEYKIRYIKKYKKSDIMNICSMWNPIINDNNKHIIYVIHSIFRINDAIFFI